MWGWCIQYGGYVTGWTVRACVGRGNISFPYFRPPPQCKWGLRSIYRRFGTTSRFHLQRSSSRLFDACRWDRWVVPKRRQVVTCQRCVRSQKIKKLTFFPYITTRLVRGPPSLLFIGCWASSREIKRPGCEVDHSLFFLAPKLRVGGVISVFPLNGFWRRQGQLYF
jgi:hypothetical protein